MAINLGSTAIADAKLGTTQVEKIYLGSEQIWGNQPTPVIQDFGEIVIYGYTYTPLSITNMTGGTITVTDEASFERAFTSYGQYSAPISVSITGDYPDDPWSWQITATSDGIQFFVDSYLLMDTMTITASGEPFTVSFVIESFANTTVDKTTTTTRAIQTQAEFNSICTSGTDTDLILGSVPKKAVKEFSFGSDVTTIPNNCLYNFTNLDTVGTSDVVSIAAIGDNFLGGCTSFVGPLTIPSGATSIGNGFLEGCTNFNSALTIPNTVTSIGNRFLDDCKNFNYPITIPEATTSIGSNFLMGCVKINSAITLPTSLQSLGASFMNTCRDFNSTITLPTYLEAIQGYFMANCSSFNQSLTLPSNLKTIGGSFLQMDSSYDAMFNQPINLPQTLTSVGQQFMRGMSKMTNYINVGSLAATIFTQNNFTLSAKNTSVPAYATGIKIKGANRAAFMSRFPNLTSSSPFRKLVDGGA